MTLDAKKIKAAVLWHALYRLHSVAAVTEYSGRGVDGVADVFGITKADYTYEFEVKVSKQDFMSEIRAIRGEPGASDTKYAKHREYLRGAYPDRIPNRYLFVVPMDWREFAVEKLKGTPYGLFSCTSTPTSVGTQEWISEDLDAKHLHKEKADQYTKDAMLRKACVEIQHVRSLLAKEVDHLHGRAKI